MIINMRSNKTSHSILYILAHLWFYALFKWKVFPCLTMTSLWLAHAMGFCQSASPSAHGQKTPKMVMLDPANDPKKYAAPNWGKP